MTYSTVALSKLFKHRYKFFALESQQTNSKRMADMPSAKRYSLGFKMKYSLGANVVEAEAFSIDKIMIGDFVLERVVAFAGNYKGRQEDDIILGTNVINNWEMHISKREHTFQFRENPPDSLPNKTNIYQNYFNKEGNYIYIQNS